ncbi:MAG TPA: zf-TFIIB domain-containing protein [Coleofasciculaceae cyanobacterium]
MRSIVCPKCRGTLEQVVCGGIEVDRCLYCKGLWFDSFEAEQLKAIKGSESLDIGDPETGSQLNQMADKVRCPRCKVRMTRMVDIDQHCIWYEICPKCQGVWLDAGEFKKFKDNFKPKGFLGRFKQELR